jgi:hypothetical protein
MVGVLTSSAIDHGLEPRSRQTKENQNWYLLLLCLACSTDLNRLGETFRQPDILNEHVKLKIKIGKSVL